MAQKTIVGLDIGTTKLRAVEAVMSNGQPKIIGIAEVSIPFQTVIGGEVRNKKVLAEALKSLWRIGKFTAKDVRVVVNSEQNIANLQTLDDEIDFAKTLPFRLKTETFKSEDYYISYHTLRKYEVQERDKSVVEGVITVPKRDIFLAATKRELIDNVLSAFALTDFRILSIDIAPLALIRGESELTDNYEEDEVDIHVNVGGDNIIVVVSNHAQPVFVRIVDGGGNKITEAVGEHLRLSDEEAEEIKIGTLKMNPSIMKRRPNEESVFGVDEGDLELDTVASYSENQLDAYDIVNEELSAIIDNITKTINYFIDQNTYGLGDNVKNLYVSGGTATFGKIRHHLIHNIGAQKTTLSRPLSYMESKGLIDKKLVEKFKGQQHELTLAVGAILGQGGEKND